MKTAVIQQGAKEKPGEYKLRDDYKMNDREVVKLTAKDQDLPK